MFSESAVKPREGCVKFAVQDLFKSAFEIRENSALKTAQQYLEFANSQPQKHHYKNRFTALIISHGHQ